MFRQKLSNNGTFRELSDSNVLPKKRRMTSKKQISRSANHSQIQETNSTRGLSYLPLPPTLNLFPQVNPFSGNKKNHPKIFFRERKEKKREEQTAVGCNFANWLPVISVSYSEQVLGNHSEGFPTGIVQLSPRFLLCFPGGAELYIFSV